MQNYQATPDYYREYVEHGILSKAHKYIKKYVNKAGNTIYVYARKVETNMRRRKRNTDPEEVTWDYGKTWKGGYVYDNGKASSTSGPLGNWSNKYNGRRDPAYNSMRGIRVNSGIAAGRRRYQKKKVNGGGYSGSSSYRKSGNLTSRGYSGSRGSTNNNKATAGALMGKANRKRIQIQSALLKGRYNYKNSTMLYTRESVGARKRRVKRIYDEERTLKKKGWISKNGILVPPKYKYWGRK